MSFKALAKPELVVFDLDNTLYDYDLAHEYATSMLIVKLETLLSSNKDEIIKNFAKARSIVKARLGNTASSHSRLLYLSELFSILKIDIDASEILRVEKIYWDAFLSKTEAFSDSKLFINELVALGTMCALVTDLTSEIQYRKLLTLGLEMEFRCVVTSEEAGGDKSTLLPWKLLDERVNLSSFSNIWYIGDSLHDLNPTMRRPQDVGLLKSTHGPLMSFGDHFAFSSFNDLYKTLR